MNWAIKVSIVGILYCFLVQANPIVGPNRRVTLEDAIEEKCRIKSSLPELATTYKKCSNWDIIDGIKDIESRHMLCLIYYDSFTSYCRNKSAQDLKLTESVALNNTYLKVSQVCNKIGILPPISEHNVSKLLTTDEACIEVCSDSMGNLEIVCKLSFYYTNHTAPVSSKQDELSSLNESQLGYAVQGEDQDDDTVTNKKSKESAPKNVSNASTPSKKSKPKDTGPEQQDNIMPQDNAIYPKLHAPESSTVKHTKVMPVNEENIQLMNPEQHKPETVFKAHIVDNKPVSKPAVPKTDPIADGTKNVLKSNVEVTPQVHIETDNRRPNVHQAAETENVDKQNAPKAGVDLEPQNAPKGYPDLELQNNPKGDGDFDTQNEDDQDFEEDIQQKLDENRVPEVSKPNVVGESINFDTDIIDSDSYFFSYFMVLCIIFIVGYVAYHNKQKILALILEGRRGKRQYRNRRPNSANYHKLDSNLEEAILSNCDKNTSNVIY